MMTSTFARAGNHPNAVAIVRYLPRWRPFRGRVYQDLAPSRAALAVKSEAEYDVVFDAQLATLDPCKVYADLGPDAVLLCYEPVGFKCHRRRVAEWLEEALGIEVPEMNVQRDQTPRYADLPVQPSKPKKQAKGQLSFLKALLGAMHP